MWITRNTATTMTIDSILSFEWSFSWYQQRLRYHYFNASMTIPIHGLLKSNLPCLPLYHSASLAQTKKLKTQRTRSKKLRQLTPPRTRSIILDTLFSFWATIKIPIRTFRSMITVFFFNAESLTAIREEYHLIESESHPSRLQRRYPSIWKKHPLRPQSFFASITIKIDDNFTV